MNRDVGKVLRGKLTACEKATIRMGFEQGIKAKDIAAKIGRSLRIVRHYYLLHRGYKVHSSSQRRLPGKPLHRIPTPPPRAKRPLIDESRFYRSNFEPT